MVVDVVDVPLLLSGNFRLSSLVEVIPVPPPPMLVVVVVVVDASIETASHLIAASGEQDAAGVVVVGGIFVEGAASKVELGEVLLMLVELRSAWCQCCCCWWW